MGIIQFKEGLKYNMNINGIDVAASFDDKAVEEIFRPLLLKLSEIRASKGKRIVAMIAAPPGAGKSTLVSFLEDMAKEVIPQYRVQAIGMADFTIAIKADLELIIQSDGSYGLLVRN